MAAKLHFPQIDFIRAIAIISVVGTHLLALQLGPTHINIAWNYLHFAVVGFVFCSAYLYCAANPTGSPLKFSMTWFRKRFQRLYAPFFVYLIVHFLLWFLFPNWLHGYGLKKSTDFIISSVTLTGGIDFGWLVLLFIQLAVISPFLLLASRKLYTRRLLLIFYLLWTIITTFFRIPDIYSRAIAWIPWSFIMLLGFSYADSQKNNPLAAKRALISVTSAGVLTWASLYAILTGLEMNLTLTVHKYPPDLFYFSYGVAVTGVLLLLFGEKAQISSHQNKLIAFISKHSYTIFFAHYILLDIITKVN